MIDTAIAYVRQEIFTDSGAALQALNYSIYQIGNLQRYFNVEILKSFVEPPLAPTPLAERRELMAALKFLEDNPGTGLLVTSLSQLSSRVEERNELVDLCLRKKYRLMSGQPLIDLSRSADQQEMRRTLQKVLM